MPEAFIDPAMVFWLEQLNTQSVREQGWIRAVRVQQNLQGKQLAKKMHVSPARISVLERDEQRGAVTLKMMQKAAEALDCRFVYALVPRASPQPAKPRIRLDAASLKGSRERREKELHQEYRRKLSGTTPD